VLTKLNPEGLSYATDGQLVTQGFSLDLATGSNYEN